MQEQNFIRFAVPGAVELAGLRDGTVPAQDKIAEVRHARADDVSIETLRRNSLDAEIARTGENARGAGRRRAHRVWSSIQIASVLGDLVLLLLAPIICHHLYLDDRPWSAAERAFVEINCILTLWGFQLTSAYTRAALQRPGLAFNSVMLGVGGAVLGTMGIGFITGEFTDTSRGWMLLSWAMSAVLLNAYHHGVTVFIARIMKAGHLREKVAIVCTGPGAQMALEKFTSALAPEVLVVGIFDDRKTRLPASQSGYEVKGNTDDLLAYIRRHAIDRVIVTIPWSAERRILELVTKLRQAPVRVDLIPHKLISSLSSNVNSIQGVQIVTVANDRVDVQMDWLKRVEDLVLGTLMLALLTPVMIGVAIAIRLDTPGPILFRQKRSGFNNEAFDVYKFRSMRTSGPNDPVLRQATKDDPRVTRVGRFIRRTSLDELPQLLNVLAGDMSLVGPRPHAVPHNDHYGQVVDGYFARHNVKPGITGWAQVSGHRGETDTVEKMNCRVQYDLEYIERWSLMFDLKIIFLTAFRVWFQKTAY
ncbi:MAG TPA: undecaprenyl-phosphate glucose phosphotransferase [Aliidongia sp.]|nr:undecaprenyl-phosphate glucose phosphotransferase [Aliidongia sp.]